MIRTVDMVVEIPTGSRNKIEWNVKDNVFRFSRMLSTATRYPIEYGFVPHSLAADGDPADIMAIMGEPTFTGCVIEVRIVGMLKMVDGGVEDNKILAIPCYDPHFNYIKKLSDVPINRLNEIQHFFKVYKQLGGKKVKIGKWEGRKKALDYLKKAFKKYEKDN